MIRKALAVESKPLKEYVLANDVEALHTNAIAQRNGDRIVKRFTEEFKEYSDVEDNRIAGIVFLQNLGIVFLQNLGIVFLQNLGIVGLSIAGIMGLSIAGIVGFSGFSGFSGLVGLL